MQYVNTDADVTLFYLEKGNSYAAVYNEAIYTVLFKHSYKIQG
jgi:hypothetical protein